MSVKTWQWRRWAGKVTWSPSFFTASRSASVSRCSVAAFSLSFASSPEPPPMRERSCSTCSSCAFMMRSLLARKASISS